MTSPHHKEVLEMRPNKVLRGIVVLNFFITCVIIMSPSLQAQSSSKDITSILSLLLFDEKLSSVIEVSNGNSHTCALLEDKTVKCWGDNSFGQLGDGTKINRLKPVIVSGISTATAIFVSTSHSCALLEDRTVKCWGDNYNGRLGDGTTTQ